MITDDGREASDDIQATDAGDEDPNYAVPFGVPDEDRASSLGFKDPAPVVKPRATARIARWIYKNLYRPWQ